MIHEVPAFAIINSCKKEAYFAPLHRKLLDFSKEISEAIPKLQLHEVPFFKSFIEFYQKEQFEDMTLLILAFSRMLIETKTHAAFIESNLVEIGKTIELAAKEQTFSDPDTTCLFLKCLQALVVFYTGFDRKTAFDFALYMVKVIVDSKQNHDYYLHFAYHSIVILKKEDKKLARSVIDSLLELNRSENKATDFLEIAQCYIAIEEYEQADYFIQKATEQADFTEVTSTNFQIKYSNSQISYHLERLIESLTLEAEALVLAEHYFGISHKTVRLVFERYKRRIYAIQERKKIIPLEFIEIRQKYEEKLHHIKDETTW